MSFSRALRGSLVPATAMLRRQAVHSAAARSQRSSPRPSKHPRLMEEIRLKGPRFLRLACPEVSAQAKRSGCKPAKTPTVSIRGFSDGSLRKGEAGAATIIQTNVSGVQASSTMFIVRLHLGSFTSCGAECWGALLTLMVANVLLAERLPVSTIEIASDHTGVCDVINGTLKMKPSRDAYLLDLYTFAKDMRRRHPTVKITARHTPKKDKIPGNVRADKECAEAAAGRTSTSIVHDAAETRNKGTS